MLDNRVPKNKLFFDTVVNRSKKWTIWYGFLYNRSRFLHFFFERFFINRTKIYLLIKKIVNFQVPKPVTKHYHNIHFRVPKPVILPHTQIFNKLNVLYKHQPMQQSELDKSVIHFNCLQVIITKF